MCQEWIDTAFVLNPKPQTLNLCQEWIDTAYNWLLEIGVKEELIDLDVHAKDKLAHYARACTDVAFKFPFGRSELLGVAARGQ